jgi:hypothetical protein
LFVIDICYYKSGKSIGPVPEIEAVFLLSYLRVQVPGIWRKAAIVVCKEYKQVAACIQFNQLAPVLVIYLLPAKYRSVVVEQSNSVLIVFFLVFHLHGDHTVSSHDGIIDAQVNV